MRYVVFVAIFVLFGGTSIGAVVSGMGGKRAVWLLGGLSIVLLALLGWAIMMGWAAGPPES